MSSRIQILLLGPPEILVNGEPLRIPHHEARTLLFYLASQGGLVRSEELLPLLWEQKTEQDARSLLGETLNQLRLALPQPQLLLSQEDRVGLDFQQVYVDQLHYRDLIDQAGHIPWQVPPPQPLPLETEKLLIQATHLWRSPQFLPGLRLSAASRLGKWRDRTNQQMQHLYERVVERLAEHALAMGDFEGSLHWAALGLAVDDLNENLHYQALHSYILMGRILEARQYFQRVQELLRQKLNSTPSMRLLDLYRQVWVQGGSPLPLSMTPIWNLHATLHTPYVGQKSSFELLQKASQEGGAVFVLGESGQGKTRLIQEFTGGLKNSPRLLLSVCRSVENNLPLQPMIELLRHSVQPDEWLALPTAWASQLALLLPELTDSPSLQEAIPETILGQGRALQFEAIRQVFLQISAQQPLVLCLDDAHWSDEATLALLGYLIERPPFSESALMVIAARWEEHHPPLEALLQTVQSSPRVHQLVLSHLSADEIREMAQYILRRPPADVLVKQLTVATGGNPLFVLETLRSLLEQPLEEGDRVEQLPLPASLKTLIHARLQLLPPETRSILEIAALIGVEFDPALLQDISQRTEKELVTFIQDFEKFLLVETFSLPNGEMRYRFSHSQIRDVLLQEVDPLRQRWLHRKIAQCLEKQGHPHGDNQAAVLAQHYEFAGEISGAFNFWILAAQRARQLFSVADAFQAYRNAERLIPGNPSLSDEQIFHLYSEWTALAFEVEDASLIERLNTDLLAMGQKRGSSLLMGAAYEGLSDASMVRNRFEDGLAYTEQAIPFLEASGNTFALMNVYNHRGVFLYMLNRVEQSIEAFQDSLTLGADSDSWQVILARANAHYQISVARTLGGWPEIGLNHALRSLAELNPLNRPHGQLVAYSAAALARYFLGDFSQARQDSQLGLELAEQIEASRMQGYLHDYRAMIELANGNCDGSLAHIEKGISLGEQCGHAETIAAGHRILGDLFSWLEAVEPSVTQYRKALETSQDQFLSLDHQFRYGASLAKAGRVAEGRKWLDKSIRTAESGGLGSVLILAQLAQANIAFQIGQMMLAQDLAYQVRRAAARRCLTFPRLAAIQLLARISLQHGLPRETIKLLQPVIQEASRIGYPWIEITSLSVLQEALQQTRQKNPTLKVRANELLDKMTAKARSNEIKDHFSCFADNMRMRFG